MDTKITIQKLYGRSPVEDYNCSIEHNIAMDLKTELKKLNINIPTINSSEYIGIEVEVENVDQTWKETTIWHPKEDSSLRNSGVEYVTTPIHANNAPIFLYQLFKDLLPPDISFSKRTSIHIHLNVLNLTIEQLKNFIYIYTIFEKSFYRYISIERKNNIFCIPLQDTNLIFAFFNQKDKAIQKVFWHKYTGFNILPIKSQGTVEFRHLHGTNNLELICNWINLITKLKEYILQTTTEEIINTIETLNTKSNYFNLTTSIFKENANLLYAWPGYHKEMAEGTSILKTQIFEHPFTNEVITQFISKQQYDKSPFLSANTLLHSSQISEQSQLESQLESQLLNTQINPFLIWQPQPDTPQPEQINF